MVRIYLGAGVVVVMAQIQSEPSAILVKLTLSKAPRTDDGFFPKITFTQ